MIYPTPVIKSADEVVAGDEVMQGSNPFEWRKVVFVSSFGVSPNHKVRLHWSQRSSNEYGHSQGVIVGFQDLTEDP